MFCVSWLCPNSFRHCLFYFYTSHQTDFQYRDRLLGLLITVNLFKYIFTPNFMNFFNFMFQAILCGISGTMVAIYWISTPRKHEFLLYCSLSILILNIINLILLEIGQVREIFTDHLKKALSKEYEFLDLENG